MTGKIYACKSDEITEREIKNAQLACTLAGECMVLLKNDDETLPLKARKIAVFGNGARHTIKGGTGSGDVNTRSNTNIETGLSEAGFEITTKAWLDRNEKYYNDRKAEYLQKVQEEAERTGRNSVYIIFDHPFEEPDIVPVTDDDIKNSGTDTAVFVIGRNSGEGADRHNVPGDYQLSPNEIENIKKLGRAYKKVAVVLNIGGIIQIEQITSIPGVSAILLMSQLGNLGGKALAELLLGNTTPSGRLADTWAKDYMDYPSSAEFSYINGNLNDDYYKDGIFVGYRYFDSFEKQVVYPFGYGLGYTAFDMKAEKIVQKGEKLVVSVNVKNTGTKYCGKEVVQVYVSAPDGKLKKPYQELKGFAKSENLACGKEQTVDVTIPLSSLASYDEKSACWIIEKGEYLVRVGKNSRDTKVAAVLVFASDFVTEKCQNILKLDCELKEITPDRKCSSEKIPSDAEKIEIDLSLLKCRENKYSPEERKTFTTNIKSVVTLEDVAAGKAKLEDLIAQLSVEEMAAMCVGVYDNGMDKNIVGSASTFVPGAAGETPDLLWTTRKIKKLILADGPAGLRLTPHFKTDKDGKLLPGGNIFGDNIEPFVNVPEGAVDYYQYCTAIPIGWALAQSWNMDLVSRIGEMIGSEMQQFGVNLWLAPAQNIHRNPLCGRNFEYYSEDPLLTGKTSAAMTRGVQKNKGCGTTIKHFAANNQEENRYFVNAHISERAIREIYLKGFEISVKEAQPLSLMTSYNLLNGTHTANQYDLIQKALRDEWGFEGVVMTDWFTSQDLPDLTAKYKTIYPISASTGCIAAGNDLQMPGCQKNVDDIVDSVKNGREIMGYKISLADLQFCTYNLLKVILKL